MFSGDAAADETRTQGPEPLLQSFSVLFNPPRADTGMARLRRLRGHAPPEESYKLIRLLRKNRLSRSPHSSAMRPPTTSGRWLVRGFLSRS
jgi:hypothetical protein